MRTNLSHTIGSLLAELPGHIYSGNESLRDFSLTGITTDSRNVADGGVFIAVRGTNVDGHTFIPRAVEAGARLIVCEEMPDSPADNAAYAVVSNSSEAAGLLAAAWYGHPSRQLTLVGVTGTNGKTTIATLLYELACMRGIKAGLLSTVVNKIGYEAIPASHTTPDPLSLNKLLADMVEAGCSFTAMEVSSHAAAQHRIAGLDFDGGIFTNLTRDHLDYHGTFSEYLKAKQSFFDNLKSEAFALANIDDRNGNIMLQNTRAKRSSYSIRANADFRGKVIENRIDGMTLSLNGLEIDTIFSGRFNASNLTAVYGASVLLGWNDEDLPVQISRLVPVSGRFQPIAGPKGITAIIDYAHTPDALVNVLDTINEIRTPAQRVITVCGCGGDRDKGKRPVMAAEACARSWKVILTSDNPRSENPEAIISDMKEGLDANALNQVHSITDRREAIRIAVQLAGPADIILIAGKGHETYQIIGDKRLHFDDSEEARQAFEMLNTEKINN